MLNTVTDSAKPVLWALADCNSFYASCERLFRPDLKNKPVVVLSNNDGCLIALTPEAKKLGFKMGDVYYLLRSKLEKLGVVSFSSNYTLYGDISRRVMETIATLTPVDQYSIDETFIPFGPAMAVQADDVGWAIHDRVAQWVGMPIRIGIGPTRTLAKLANFWAKRKTRVFRLELDTRTLEDVLEQTPTGEIWGIGRRQSAKLARIGIMNARQLRDMDLGRALKLLTVVGQRTVYELRGHQCIMDNDIPVPRKTLVSSRSFGRRIRRMEDLAEALSMHAAIAGERLRKENIVASSISIWAETSRYMETPYRSIGAHGRFVIPTNCTTEIIRAAHDCLDRCFDPGDGWMKGGLMLYDLAEEATRQVTLLEACMPCEDTKSRELMRTLDKINDLYGRDTLRLAAQGNSDAFWHMRRQLMSPYYTTRLSDLRVVHCR